MEYIMEPVLLKELLDEFHCSILELVIIPVLYHSLTIRFLNLLLILTLLFPLLDVATLLPFSVLLVLFHLIHSVSRNLFLDFIKHNPVPGISQYP